MQACEPSCYAGAEDMRISWRSLALLPSLPSPEPACSEGHRGGQFLRRQLPQISVTQRLISTTWTSLDKNCPFEMPIRMSETLPTQQNMS